MIAVRLAGVSHAPGYPSNLLDLVHRIDHDDQVPVELVRDLDNGDDLNATAVQLEGRDLGWIPRHLAAGLAPRLDAGHQVQAHAVRVAVDPDHRDRPGLDITLTEARP